MTRTEAARGSQKASHSRSPAGAGAARPVQARARAGALFGEPPEKIPFHPKVNGATVEVTRTVELAHDVRKQAFARVHRGHEETEEEKKYAYLMDLQVNDLFFLYESVKDHDNGLSGGECHNTHIWSKKPSLIDFARLSSLLLSAASSIWFSRI